MPALDITGTVFPAGGLLCEILVDLLVPLGKGGRNIVEGCEGARGHQQHRVVLGVGIRVGGDDVENHLVEHTQAIFGRQISASLQEELQAGAGKAAHLVLIGRKDAVCLCEIFLVQPADSTMVAHIPIVTRDGQGIARVGLQYFDFCRSDPDGGGEAQTIGFILNDTG